MSKKPVIGFIGVGYMGHGMAKNILAGGYELWIKGNKNRTPIDSLTALGAHEASSPQEIGAKLRHHPHLPVKFPPSRSSD